MELSRILILDYYYYYYYYNTTTTTPTTTATTATNQAAKLKQEHCVSVKPNVSMRALGSSRLLLAPPGSLWLLLALAVTLPVIVAAAAVLRGFQQLM